MEDIKVPYDDILDQYSTPYATDNLPQASTLALGGNSAAGEPHTYSGVDSYRKPFWGRIVPDSLACRLYLLTVLIETAIDLAIEGDLLVRLNDSPNLTGGSKTTRDKMPTYLGIFALAHVFQFSMAVDAVYARNTLQFIALAIFNILFLAYAIIQIGEIQSASVNANGIIHIPVKVLTDIIPVIISIAELAYIGLGWKIYNEFGWKVYKFLGADRRIKGMYASYQIFECLIKFDVFFWVGFCVQFIWLVLQPDNWVYYVMCATLPLSIVLLVEGHLAARYENKWMMLGFMTGCAGALVYFTYNLVKVVRFRHTTEYVDVWKSLTTFSAIAIALLILTIVFTVIVMRNFGRGLKTSMTRTKTTRGRSNGSAPARRASNHLNRMSIE